MAFTTINKSSLYQNTVLYTGNGSTQSITGVGFQPDFIWIKARNDTRNHQLQDSVRNDFADILNSDSDGAQGTFTDGVTAVGSDGFSVGARAALNTTSDTLVAWNWKAGTTSGITTNGSTNITPLGYSFNATAGQSIIYYNGNQTAGDKVPHGLGVKPDLIIVKDVVDANSWNVYHVSNGATKYMLLDSSESVNNNTNRWNDTEPDSVNFTLGASAAVNGNDNNYVAYCFASKRGYSRAGHYTGDSSSSGQFIYTGFKPTFILLKNSPSSADWQLIDNKRLGYNVDNNRIKANSTQAEATTDYLDLLSNGFKIRSGSGDYNASGDMYIYMAFGQSIVGTNNIPATAR